jgi:phosphoribosyl-dephospho-CoA transferase
MELNPHDLIRIAKPDNLVADRALPEWAIFSLKNAPFVVVRRSHQPDNFVAVGVRGLQRGQRLAAWLKRSEVQEIVTPDMLVFPGNWKTEYYDELSKPILTLKKITPILNRTNLPWGPTGSTGFELATGVKTLTENGDLDLVLNVAEPLPIKYAVSLLEKLNSISLVRLDIQLNTPLGGTSLQDYVISQTVLVKTMAGPMLVKPSALWSDARVSGTLITT